VLKLEGKSVEEKEQHPLMRSLSEMFYGKSEEVLTYNEADSEVCRFTKATFGVVNVDSRDGELYQAFRKCQALEVEDFETESKTKTKAHISVKILQPPKVLSFYVNRVQYDAKHKCLTKNNRLFSFPKELDIDLFNKNPRGDSASIQERLALLHEEERQCLE
jgi:signal-transduction protein with cAMP-binding, CBS, and nucleotidyltransferase domain